MHLSVYSICYPFLVAIALKPGQLIQIGDEYIKLHFLTNSASAVNLCKKFEPITGYKLFNTFMVFQNKFFEKDHLKKKNTVKKIMQKLN